MIRPVILPLLLLALAGCTDVLATAYQPVARQIVGIATEKKDPPPAATANPPADPAARVPAR